VAQIELRPVDLPDFGSPSALPDVDGEEYEARIDALRQRVTAEWVCVYGDREHSANLLFLTGFDPRFEEALLVLAPDGRRLLLVGNEGVGHAVEARIPLEVVLCQSLSLMGQPRDREPRLDAIFRRLGLTAGTTVGVAGWKYLGPDETDESSAPAYVPAFVIDALRATGADVRDVTSVLMHPETGLRARSSAAQIAAFEWAAARTSAAVLRVVGGARPGMTERQVAGLMGYEGEPLSCHVIVASGRGPINGLRSPSDRRLDAGDGITCGIGYWGALTCRAGLLTAEEDETFFGDFVGPYFAALTAWYGSVRLGATGDEVHAAVLDALGGASFRPLLNPGHLISYDEWVHSPIFAGSEMALGSGMLLQCDVIPSPLPDGRALNCEDGIALADEALRARLQHQFPEVWRRIEARRAFMQEALGISLVPEVLPLSSAPAYLPPFWLSPDLVCVAR
jgi:hypothetical protein